MRAARFSLHGEFSPGISFALQSTPTTAAVIGVLAFETWGFLQEVPSTIFFWDKLDAVIAAKIIRVAAAACGYDHDCYRISTSGGTYWFS